jgi:hypothetical protein
VDTSDAPFLPVMKIQAEDGEDYIVNVLLSNGISVSRDIPKNLFVKNEHGAVAVKEADAFVIIEYVLKLLTSVILTLPVIVPCSFITKL